MSRSGNNEDFRFFNPTEGEPLSQSQRYDIHPMELVVQSLVGGPLEALSNHLQTLHESQVVLIARLKIMEESMYTDYSKEFWEVKG
ncbi:hypothetical protein BN7_136 [Wickerhamomyces ciferrii]|uniref:Uncharacterized protein n=1 Tax=Wickerhamomyces ciferrii (strain ATCC 14091 / BCRC 22168 / CBS 111 / JCM 3599 / NBRC 0793 / NRRL Y-1031 F-60-10) TaxID=1206466 RepID=K0KHF2_WICCF|nr:uncharacterized protein BN7_136 [Wickerhamomyces ciferrii]CCH40603.1 hypothetical protein BN7_136 [Wickerhamomyces ciferrii]